MPPSLSSPGFNLILAKKWLRRAVEVHGYSQAQYDLGGILLSEGPDTSVEEGLGLMRLAARQGHTESLVVLGRRDMDEGRMEDAVNKFRIAADKGSSEGFNELGMCFYGEKAGNLVSEMGAIEGGDKGRKNQDTFECFAAAAARGSGAGWYNLGQMYETGKGVDRDLVHARRCYENAAEIGLSKGQGGLGRLLLHSARLSLSIGETTETPYEEYGRALKYLRAASGSHEPLACYELGMCYLTGVKHWDNQIVPKDELAALGMLSIAADRGQGDLRGRAAVVVGNIHYGKRNEEGMREARRYYKVAAEEGNVEGMNSLGLMIEVGNVRQIEERRERRAIKAVSSDETRHP